MSGLFLVWLAVLGIIALMFAPKVFGWIRAVLSLIWPSTGTSSAMTGVDTAISIASNAAQLTVAFSALQTLRLLDVANPDLDIATELGTIADKIHAAMKARNKTADTTAP